MRVVLIGAPGTGKGTQAKRLVRHLGVAHVSTGDRLRAEVATGSPLGRELAGYLRTGDLVPDELVLRLIWDTIVAAARAGGYVLDGFPRTVPQARAVDERSRGDEVAPEVVVDLAADAHALVPRMLARAQEEGRVDDTEPVIRHRLEVFDTETRPVLDYFAERGLLVRVDASAPVDDVFDAIVRALPAEPRLG